MAHPIERYSYILAKTLKMRQRTLIQQVDVHEIMEWMAFDKTCDPDFVKEIEQDRLKQLSADEQYALFKAEMGG